MLLILWKRTIHTEAWVPAGFHERSADVLFLDQSFRLNLVYLYFQFLLQSTFLFLLWFPSGMTVHLELCTLPRSLTQHVLSSITQ